MSTANKLTYLNVTKQKLKQAINNIGGEVTDETTFRNYVAELENAYDRLPKTEFEEGESVTLENTLKGKLDYENGVVGIGQTSQDIDLTENNVTSQTAYGLTITKNSDGSITINGTASNTLQLNLLNNTYGGTEATARTLQSGTYQLTGCPSGSDNGSKFKVDILRSGYAILVDTGSGNIANVSSSETYTMFRIVIYSGTVCNNVVFRPKLLKIPSPSYPQEIKYVRGKNKFNINTQKENTIYNYTNKTWDTAGNWNSSDYISVEQNSDYTLSFGSFDSGMQNYITFLDSKKDYISGGSGTAMGSLYRTVTTPINCKYIVFGYRDDKNPTNIMLETGNQATPYLPYNTIEEVVSGKNLFDDSSHKNKDVPSSAGFYINNAPFNLSGGTYRFGVFVDNQLITTPALMALSFKSGGTTVLEKNAPNQDITITDEQASIIDRVSLYFNGTFVSTYSGKKITGVMITTSEITTYEPYITPTTYQLSLGDIELCGIGDYQDYIYKSGDNWYTHKIVEKTPLANKVVARLNTVTSGEYRFIFSLNNAYRSTDPTEVCRNYCNVAKGGTREDTNVQSFDCITYGIDGNDYYLDGVIYLNDTKTMTVEQFNAYASQKNIVLYYQLATPTDTEITDTTLIEQLNAWYNAQSNNGTTIITSNGNLPMIIKVRGLKGE